MRLPTEIEGVTVVPVRTSSHRSRQRLARLVGHKIPNYFRFTKGIDTTWLYLVPSDLLDAASAIKGVTPARKWEDDEGWRLPW